MDNIIDFNCDLKNITKEEIISLLPSTSLWKTRILEATKTKSEDSETPTIRLRFLINAKTIDNVKLWIQTYQEQTLCTYYIRDTPFCKGRYLLFKQRLNCHHNTKTWNVSDALNYKRKRRNTNCPSYMKVTLFSPAKINRKRIRKHVPDVEMPCEIVIVPTHNHEVNNAEALSWRRVSNDVKKKLIDLYERGHNASTAREIIKLEIYTSENCMDLIGDRKFCPDYNYCYNLYRKYVKNKPEGNEEKANNEGNVVERLVGILEEYNERTNEDSCRFFQYGEDEKNFIICICPPMLRRVHEHIKLASDVVFLDSIKSEKKSTDKTQLYILLTPSECGGLPLGVIITSENNSEALCNGFEIFKDMLGEKLFRGKLNGPKIFITDDNVVEKESVKKSWSDSINLLCIYHVLRSVFRFVVKSKNVVKKSDQLVLFQDFRSIMFANTNEELMERFEKADENGKEYPNYQKFLYEYFNRKNLWALCYRPYFLSEAALRLLKEQMFERIKSFNVVQMVDFILTKFMTYYERKLLDATTKNQIQRFIDPEYSTPPEHLKHKIQNLGNKLYLVPCDVNENLFFVVNTDILSCSCVNSIRGENCKHIEWLLAIEPSEERTVVDDDELKKLFYFVATGRDLSTKNDIEDEFLNIKYFMEDLQNKKIEDKRIKEKDVQQKKKKTIPIRHQRKILPKNTNYLLIIQPKNEEETIQNDNNIVKNKLISEIDINTSIERIKNSENDDNLCNFNLVETEYTNGTCNSDEERKRSILERINENLSKVLEESSSNGLNCLEKFNQKLEKMNRFDVITALESFGNEPIKHKNLCPELTPRKKRRKTQD